MKKILKFNQLLEKNNLDSIAKSLDISIEEIEDSSTLMDMANKLMEDESDYEMALMDAELAIEMYVEDNNNDISYITNKSLFNDDKEEYMHNFNKLYRDLITFSKDEKFDVDDAFKAALKFTLGEYIKKNVK